MHKLPLFSWLVLASAVANAQGSGLALEEVVVTAQKREEGLQDLELNLRVLGYALFEKFHGKGYVTEAIRGLIAGYEGAIEEWKACEGKLRDGKEVVFYVEAGVDQDNRGSQKVLRKLGFRTVGLKIEKEKTWLNGGWRGPGWWITGLYL